jgi:hypothetical protein
LYSTTTSAYSLNLVCGPDHRIDNAYDVVTIVDIRRKTADVSNPGRIRKSGLTLGNSGAMEGEESRFIRFRNVILTLFDGLCGRLVNPGESQGSNLVFDADAEAGFYRFRSLQHPTACYDSHHPALSSPFSPCRLQVDIHVHIET